MTDKDIFAERERGLEAEYIHKKEQELIEKLHKQRNMERDRRDLEDATGIANDEILAALQELGYNAETVRLMPLIPLVQVAWAEGGVTDKEHDLIMEIAEARGITSDSREHEMLSDMLDHQPSKDFFDNALRGLNYILEAIPEDLRADSQNSLVTYCTQIADASGGILGFGTISNEEKLLIARIATELGNRTK